MVNYLAVLVAAIAAYVLGFLWYGPVFGKKWMSLMNLSGKDKEKAKQKGMTKAYITTFVSMLVMAGVLAFFVDLQITSLVQGELLLLFPPSDLKPALLLGLGNGVLIGFLAWLGFLATTMLGKVFWENKPWALYALDAGHYLVTLVVMGAILGAWA